LLLPESAIEKEEFGRMEGVLVAASPMAFKFEDWPADVPGPMIGDRVVFSRYQATELTGRDGGKYWMMKDRSIAGVME
jgi:co-chaperonin GroES (HSP10)